MCGVGGGWLLVVGWVLLGDWLLFGGWVVVCFVIALVSLFFCYYEVLACWLVCWF